MLVVIEPFAHTAHCLREIMPADAVICRYGGEEFVVILPHAGIGTMTPLADALLQQIGADAFDQLHPQVRLSLSIGIARWETGEQSFQLLERADQACYRAKRAGRNQWQVA